MENKNKKCFVCDQFFSIKELNLNTSVNMFVCNNCRGTENEKLKEAGLLDSLAEGFVCGCI